MGVSRTCHRLFPFKWGWRDFAWIVVGRDKRFRDAAVVAAAAAAVLWEREGWRMRVENEMI